MESTLRLFKALPVEDEMSFHPVLDMLFAKATIREGFIIDPRVSALYGGANVVSKVANLYGRNSDELNSTFHKSWKKVAEAPIAQLVVEQCLHYLSTYGAQAVGVFDEAHIFIPGEHLDAPELSDGLRLVVIRGLTKGQLREELSKLLSGVALAQQTVDDVTDVAKFVGFTADDIATVRNKEVRVALYDHLYVVPTNPEEFLRYVVYKATGKGLLIKSRDLITELRERDNSDLEKLFLLAASHGGQEIRLASIFHRYKPIFLALRTTPMLKKTVNRIRRLANEHHKPMREDYLNGLTARLKSGGIVSLADLPEALAEANTFRKVRLAQALKFRLSGSGSVLYRVRNGKSWATEFSFDRSRYPVTDFALQTVLDSIADDIRPNVDGKRIFIPAGLKYALPATEKQFTGNLPSGTCVEVADNMVVGVHWFNLDGPRGGKGSYGIDLDLSLTNADSKIGWDGAYRDRGNGVFFSGDITNAPPPIGATEAVHVNAQARGSWLLNLNYYNYRADAEVPFKIVVGRDSQRNFGRQYTIDPNNIVALSNSSIDVRRKTLGVLVADDEGTRFYFAESAFGSGISARHTAAAEHARNYLVSNYTNSVSLNDMLTAAGAELVDSPADADIDLSWESIDKTTILDLLTATPELAGACK